MGVIRSSSTRQMISDSIVPFRKQTCNFFFSFRAGEISVIFSISFINFRKVFLTVRFLFFFEIFITGKKKFLFFLRHSVKGP